MKKFLIISSVFTMSLTQAIAIEVTGSHQKIIDINNDGKEKFLNILNNSTSIAAARKSANNEFLKRCTSNADELDNVETCKKLAIKYKKLMLEHRKYTNSKGKEFVKILEDTIKELEGVSVG